MQACRPVSLHPSCPAFLEHGGRPLFIELHFALHALSCSQLMASHLPEGLCGFRCPLPTACLPPLCTAPPMSKGTVRSPPRVWLSDVYQLRMKLLEQFQNTRNTSLSISLSPSHSSRIHHNNDNKSRGFLSVPSIRELKMLSAPV